MIALEALVAAALAIGASDPWAQARAESAAVDVADALEGAEPLYDGPDGERRTALLLLAIGFRESRWDAGALGDRGDACGAAQLHPEWRIGWTCRQVRRSPALGYRLALEALRSLKATCGGPTERWLGAYATGRCGGAPSVARARCGLVQGCEWR